MLKFDVKVAQGFIWKYIVSTAQKMTFFIKDFFSKCDHIDRKPWIWSHLLKKPLMENPAALLGKRLSHRCFPVFFCEVFQNTFFNEHLRVAASLSQLSPILYQCSPLFQGLPVF